MDNIKIDYNLISERIEGQLLSVAGDTPIEVDQERQFVKIKTLDPKKIYFVVSYGSASVSFGQSVLTATITAISERNSFESAREILSLFAVRYNLKSDGNMLETISTPQMLEAFSEFTDGYRASMETTMTIVLRSETSEAIKRLSFKTPSGAFEEVKAISFLSSCTMDVRPQPLPGQGGFATSIVGFASYSFTVVTYYDTSEFCKALDDIQYGVGNEDNSFEFKIELKSGKEITRSFKCALVQVKQEMGDVAYVTAGFSM